MHRSGTSVVTGSLEAAGLYLGEVNNAAPYNKRGNKENESIRDLNDDLLTRADAGWNAPPENQVTWSAEDEQCAQALIRPFREAGRPWGFKDPRSIWTVEGWLHLIPDARPLGVFRHPSLAVHSLGSRRGSLFVAADDALRLWCAYNRELIRLHEKYRFPLLHFDTSGSSFESFKASLTRFARSLGLAGGTDSFFNEELLQHRDAKPLWSMQAMGIYSRLRVISRRYVPEGSEPSALATFPCTLPSAEGKHGCQSRRRAKDLSTSRPEPSP